MKCPYCKLENPPKSLKCDCGYEFLIGNIKNSNTKNHVKRIFVMVKYNFLVSTFLLSISMFIYSRREQMGPTPDNDYEASYNLFIGDSLYQISIIIYFLISLIIFVIFIIKNYYRKN